MFIISYYFVMLKSRKAMLLCGFLCGKNRLIGGEGEIRTLEPISGLHDFQSCALDQLRDFSVSCSFHNGMIIPFFEAFVNSKFEKNEKSWSPLRRTKGRR